MAKLQNRKTGKIYDVSEKEATDILSGTWARAFKEIKEPKKATPPKETIVKKDDVKEVEKPLREKKGNK